MVNVCFYSPTGVAHSRADGEACTCRPVRLSEPQKEFLFSARDFTDTDDTDGMGAKGSARRTADVLERYGLVRYIGHGTCNDDESDDREYPIYAITERGGEIAELLERQRPAADNISDSQEKNR